MDIYSQKKKDIKELLEQIKVGSQRIKLIEPQSTMVIGNTGAGKTTLAAYISGMEISIKQNEDGDSYYDYQTVKEGQSKIGLNQMKSETTIPNSFVEGVWDCPGFSDSNGINTDIINAYYLKKIVDQSKSLKLILVIDGKSLEGNGCGENRGAALKSVVHTLNSMQQNTSFDIEKNLLIVLTKVTENKKVDYFRNKLKQLFVHTNGHNSKETFSFSNAQIQLFPLLESLDKGSLIPPTYKNSLINAINSLSYTDSKLNYPLSDATQQRIQDILEFSNQEIQNQIRSIFGILFPRVQHLKDVNLNKLASSITELEVYQGNTQIEFVQFLKIFSSIISPFSSDPTIKSIIPPMKEQIQFYFTEVLGGVLNTSLSETKKQIQVSFYSASIEQLVLLVMQEKTKRDQKKDYEMRLIEQQKLIQQSKQETEEKFRKHEQELNKLLEKLEKEQKGREKDIEYQEKRERLLNQLLEQQKERDLQLKEIENQNNRKINNLTEQYESQLNSLQSEVSILKKKKKSWCSIF